MRGKRGEYSSSNPCVGMVSGMKFGLAGIVWLGLGQVALACSPLSGNAHYELTQLTDANNVTIVTIRVRPGQSAPTPSVQLVQKGSPEWGCYLEWKKAGNLPTPMPGARK